MARFTALIKRKDMIQACVAKRGNEGKRVRLGESHQGGSGR